MRCSRTLRRDLVDGVDVDGMVDGEGVVVESLLLIRSSLDGHLSRNSHPLGRSVMTRVMLAVFVSCDGDGDGVDVSVLVLLVWMVEGEVSVKCLTTCWIFA